MIDLLGEGGYGEVHVDLLSCVEYNFKLCVVIRFTKANKEEECFVDVALGWG